MLCRVAEDLFWMSRYAERALSVVRLVDVTRHLELDVGEGTEDPDLWLPLLGSHSPPAGSGPIKSTQVRDFLTLDVNNPNSLVTCVYRARSAARGVRESISSEVWELINTLYLSIAGQEYLAAAAEDLETFLKGIRESLQAFQGLYDSTLARDEAWQFITLGTYLERAYNVAHSVILQLHLLSVEPESAAANDETVRWLAVLRSCGCAEAYARHYSLRVDPARVTEFLLLNEAFPQSMRFSVSAAWDSLVGIAGTNAAGNPAIRGLGRLRAHLEHGEVDEVLQVGLKEFLEDVQSRITTVSNEITGAYFRDEPVALPPIAVERAAMLMAFAHQQQQQQQ